MLFVLFFVFVDKTLHVISKDFQAVPRDFLRKKVHRKKSSYRMITQQQRDKRDERQFPFFECYPQKKITYIQEENKPERNSDIGKQIRFEWRDAPG
jgi:hypothetical protein